MCRRLGNDGSDYFNDYSERYFVVIAIAVVVVVAIVVVTAVYALGLPQCLPATIAMERERERERVHEYSFSPSSGTFNSVNDNWSCKIRKHLLPAAAFSVGSLNSIQLNRCESS